MLSKMIQADWRQTFACESNLGGCMLYQKLPETGCILIKLTGRIEPRLVSGSI